MLCSVYLSGSRGLATIHMSCMQISGETVGDIRVVPDMHTRKAMMSAEADAFIGIPGGFGTLEEVPLACAHASLPM